MKRLEEKRQEMFESEGYICLLTSVFLRSTSEFLKLPYPDLGLALGCLPKPTFDIR
jgi:hypothetical protein